MTERGAPPPAVIRGRIKVDARRALDKLRDHMLVDHHLYACEIARLAIAIGATAIDIAHDAEDVIFTFDGSPLPMDAVTRVRDYILTPAEGPDGDALRALGIGVSAALALDPAFVDVFCALAGRCERVRFAASYVAPAEEAAGDEESAAPVPEVVALPAGMGRAGMRVQVRRRLGLQTIGRAVRRELPQELALLLTRTRDAPIPIRVMGSAVGSGPAVVLRVELDEPSVSRGVLEVLSPSVRANGESSLLFLERGVLLAKYGLPGCWELGREHGSLPVRVLVDAPRLPTNASRSMVRMEAELPQRVLARIAPAFEVAVAALRTIAGGGQGPGRADMGHVVTVLGDRGAITDALGAIAAEVAIAARSGRTVPPNAVALLDLPLLRDAVGAPLALSALQGGSGAVPLLVHTGPAPVPEVLAPWLTGIVWRRGVAAERALEHLVLASASDRVQQAMEGHARRARALEHAPSPTALAASSSYVLKESFLVTEGPFAGLEGEIAIVRSEGHYRRSGTARIFVEQRALETVQLPGVALPVDMALAWPGKIRARFTYDAVERDETLSRALVYALRVAATAIGERAGESDPELVRLAMLAWAVATRTLGDAPVDAVTLGKLAGAMVWSTTAGTTSFAAIEAYARRTGGVCVARLPGTAPDGRIVVHEGQREALEALLPPKTRFVSYDRFLAQPSDASHAMLAQNMAGLTAIAISHSKVNGFIAVGPNRRRLFHAGLLLRDEANVARNGPVLLVLDDAGAVPAPGNGVLWSTPVPGLWREEDALVDLVLERCERNELAFSDVSVYLEASAQKLRERAEGSSKEGEAARLLAIAARIAELPAAIERQKRAVLKSAIVAGPKVDLDAIVGSGPRASATTPRRGSVTVAVARDRLRAEVLFEGHRLCAANLFALPVIAVVELSRESDVDGWTTLSEEGTRWARSAGVDAAINLLGGLAREASFASDALSLELAVALLDEAPGRALAALHQVRWPTVQGGSLVLPAEVGELSWGAQLYSPWRTDTEPSTYDAPAVHLPANAIGALRHKVLAGIGHELVDMTERIAKLQARRARGRPTAMPRLDGAPAHPRLRTSLGTLDVTVAEGELELVDGVLSDVARIADDGARHSVAFPLGCAVRMVYRADEGVLGSTVMAELVTAVERHVRRLGADLGLVPDFVRDRLRGLLCSAIARGSRSPADDALAVFRDTSGGWRSIAELAERVPVRITRDAPPWLPVGVWGVAPEDDGQGVIVSLSDAEAQVLRAILPLKDETEALRRARRGLERRRAPQLAEVRLDEETRAKCLFTFLFDESGICGEVGLLRPDHAALRRIDVYTTRRPLVRIDDPEGWPLAAVLDDAEIEAAAAFDGFADEKKAIARLHRMVRMQLGTRLATMLEAPKEALGVVRLPAPFLVRSAVGTTRPVACLGVFWLERTWPEAPEVHVEGMNLVDPFRRPRIPEGTEGAHHRVLPIRGRLHFSGPAGALDAVTNEVFAWVHHRIGPIIRLAAHSVAMRSGGRIDPTELAAYQWDLALLGASSGEDHDPIAELARDRPDEVLVRVATRRAPHLMVQTGEEEEARVAAMEARAPTALRGAPSGDASGPPPKETPPGESFLAGLVRRVVALVSSDAVTADETTASGPLAIALGAALGAMKLTGDPVRAVIESKRGRPVRYDGASRLVVVNTRHAVVRAIANHPSCTLFLLAAAVSEINRELVPVTDAEELAVILDLLRAVPNETLSPSRS